MATMKWKIDRIKATDAKCPNIFTSVWECAYTFLFCEHSRLPSENANDMSKPYSRTGEIKTLQNTLDAQTGWPRHRQPHAVVRKSTPDPAPHQYSR